MTILQLPNWQHGLSETRSTSLVGFETLFAPCTARLSSRRFRPWPAARRAGFISVLSDVDFESVLDARLVARKHWYLRTDALLRRATDTQAELRIALGAELGDVWTRSYRRAEDDGAEPDCRFVHRILVSCSLGWRSFWVKAADLLAYLTVALLLSDVAIAPIWISCLLSRGSRPHRSIASGIRARIKQHVTAHNVPAN